MVTLSRRDSIKIGDNSQTKFARNSSLTQGTTTNSLILTFQIFGQLKSFFHFSVCIYFQLKLQKKINPYQFSRKAYSFFIKTHKG